MSSSLNMMGLGDDQMASQYGIVFPEGIPGGGNAENITLRMDQQFDPPEDNTTMYEIIFRGMKIPKTSMTHEMTKEAIIMVRIDQTWEIYKDLIAWSHKCYDPINGTALPDSMVRTTMLVQMYDGQGKVVQTFRFRGTKLKGLKVETLDNASADPLRVTLNFIFNDMISE